MWRVQRTGERTSARPDATSYYATSPAAAAAAAAAAAVALLEACAKRSLQARRHMLAKHRASEGLPQKSPPRAQQEPAKPVPEPQHSALAMEAAMSAQNNHLALQLQASEQRAVLLERRLQERQVSDPAASAERLPG